MGRVVPEMFGKRYDWTKVNGSLSLIPESVAPAEATSPLTYAGFLRGLAEIEATEYPVPKLFMSGPVDEWVREELMRYGAGERGGRIPMAGGGHGVSDEEAG